jgi:hypothetical protein
VAAEAARLAGQTEDTQATWNICRTRAARGCGPSAGNWARRGAGGRLGHAGCGGRGTGVGYGGHHERRSCGGGRGDWGMLRSGPIGSATCAESCGSGHPGGPQGCQRLLLRWERLHG